MVSDPLPKCYGVALLRAMHTYFNFACIFLLPFAQKRDSAAMPHAHHTRSRPSNAVWGAGPGNDPRKKRVAVQGRRPSVFAVVKIVSGIFSSIRFEGTELKASRAR